MTHPDSFGARSTLSIGGDESRGLPARRAPVPLRRRAPAVHPSRPARERPPPRGRRHRHRRDVEAVATWNAQAEPSREITFAPARVLLQDFTGVPAIVDLAAMRDAMAGSAATRADRPADPGRARDRPLRPGRRLREPARDQRNAELEFERNRERYAFLRWGQGAFDELQGRAAEHGICPPGQPRVPRPRRRVARRAGRSPTRSSGTDSHTTMINGLGVLGWGVGGIEAEAAMLGEAISMLVPQVVGFRLHGQLPEGATATDLVLTVTQILRATGVVGKFVEYFGEGLAGLPLADRATIGNMSPEYGATCGFFPVDDETLRYLRLTGRDETRVALVEAYCKENLLWHDPKEAGDVLARRRARPRHGRAVASPGRGARRTASRSRAARPRSSRRCSTFGVDYGSGVDEAVAESFPASDAPAHADPGAPPRPLPTGRAGGARRGRPDAHSGIPVRARRSARRTSTTARS